MHCYTPLVRNAENGFPGLRVPGAKNQGVRMQPTLLNVKALQRSFTMRKFEKVLKDTVTRKLLSRFIGDPQIKTFISTDKSL